jgi:hypothetical protein
MTDDERRNVSKEDIYATEREGQAYRGTAYVPVPDAAADEAPEDDNHPDPGTGGLFHEVDLPKVPKIKHVVGPSAIMLGASLGSGETLFWPNLVAREGWGIIWLFIVGVFTQFIINTETQRWTVLTGESIFRSFQRVHEGWPWVFLVGGLVSLGWPGWAASAAELGATALGLDRVSVLSFTLDGWRALGIFLMVLIWMSYQVSALMYNVVERVQSVLIALSIGLSVVLVGYAGAINQIRDVPAGLMQIGTFPASLDLTSLTVTATVVGALAYAGAGGYLNLSQSLWVREKGFGMSVFQGRVKNPLIGDQPEPIERNGFTFFPTPSNLERWRGWWRLVQLEHLLTFLLGLVFAGLILMMVAIEYAAGTAASPITMWIGQIIPALPGAGGTVAVLVIFLALFTTEYAIVESFVRNSAEVIYETVGHDRGWDRSRIFWMLLTVFIAWGILILVLPIQQPFFILVAAAASSGIIMWPYTALIIVINTTRLPEHTQPGWIRTTLMWWGTAFYGYFSILLIGNVVANAFGIETFRTTIGIVDSGAGGHLLWAVFLGVQVVTMWISWVGKRESAGTVEGTERIRSLMR